MQMIDADQGWNVQEAIEYVASLEETTLVRAYVYFFGSIVA